MKSDLDQLLKHAGLDGLAVFGSSLHNPAMRYMVGDVFVNAAIVVKQAGQEPVLVHRAMERDEAAQTGMSLLEIEKYPWKDFLEEAGGDTLRAEGTRWSKIFSDLGVHGRVAIYGHLETNQNYGILRHLDSLMPGVELVSEPSARAVLNAARTTKTDDEIERIRRMGEITTEVVGLTAEFLSEGHGKDGLLVDSAGQPIRIGAIKRQIDLWLAERGAENVEGVIFAVGRDAGVPHSVGHDDDVLPLGQTVIFDIFPAETGGGYFYDFTRTWCLGHATDQASQLYQDVLETYETVFALLKAGAAPQAIEKATCDQFEAQGHPTYRNTVSGHDGYVHSLGHGVGLAIHEQPSFRLTSDSSPELLPGMVFTIEPGLYYPEQGMGVRLEDTILLNASGEPQILADYPKDLVLKIAE